MINLLSIDSLTGLKSRLIWWLLPVGFSLLFAGCVNDDLGECPSEVHFKLRFMDENHMELAQLDPSVEQAAIFAFDEDGTYMSGEELMSRREIRNALVHRGDKETLKISLWACVNISQKFMQRLSGVKNIEEMKQIIGRYSEICDEEGRDILTRDLYFGRLNGPFQLGRKRDSKTYYIDVFKRTAQINVQILGYEEWVNNLGEEGLSNASVSMSGFHEGLMPFEKAEDTEMNIELNGTVTDGNLYIAPFKVFPTKKDALLNYNLKFGNKTILSFSKGTDGEPFVAQAGKMLNVLIDLRHGSLRTMVVVTPWNVVHQFTIY